MVFFSFNEIKKKKETLIGVVLGQMLSLLSTSIGFTTLKLRLRSSRCSPNGDSTDNVYGSSVPVPLGLKSTDPGSL